MSGNKIINATYPVKGMTCAACAQSVESMIKSVDGVEDANVNFATATVYVKYNSSVVGPEKIDKSVKSIGYELVLSKDAENSSERSNFKTRFMVAMVFSLPIVFIAMVFHKITYGNWIMLFLSLPVIFYSGINFYISAFKKALHKTFTMDTLIALGTGSAFLFSVFNTIFPEYLIQRGLEPHVYYESAVVIIALILLGKYL
ncbi:MAG: cation-translocating P-type ATPase, partial [Moraxellaceae bacterium]